VFEKTCATTQKYVKSHVFWILKKNVKKRMYNFTGHLITELLIQNYGKSVPVCHQHQTSCWEMRTKETMQLRTVWDKRLIAYKAISPHNIQNFYRHSANSFW